MGWWGGFDEAGPVAFFGGGMEGELTDDEGFATEIEEGEIHFPFRVIEDSHFGDFADEPFDVRRAVCGFDSE